jgi:hypothetical protein
MLDLEGAVITPGTCSLLCRCGRTITRPLRSILGAVDGHDARPRVRDGEMYEVPQGFDDLPLALPGDFLVNAADLFECAERGGKDGVDGPNLFCSYDHDVATALSARWGADLVVVHRAKIRVGRSPFLGGSDDDTM